MSVEVDIRQRLQEGQSPKSLVAMGYKKSTVYKVYSLVRTFSTSITRPLWSIDDMTLDHLDHRYRPGDIVTISFKLNNRSDRSLYIEKVGLRPEWMGNLDHWYCNLIQDLLKPDQFVHTTISFRIPNDIAFGEYELFFGVECQYLPVHAQENTNLTTIWSNPYILEVKRSVMQTLFLSHSIKDKQLVVELEQYLDNNGIKVILGEDVSEPGSILEMKFRKLIDSSDLFMAIITEPAVRSKWVSMEINHAISVNRPMILLKDTLVNLNIGREWIPFSKSNSTESIFHSVMSAFNNINSKRFNIDTTLLGNIAVALFAFLVGWNLSESMNRR